MVLNLELTVEEANVILNSLAKQPYEAVNQIINKIQQQAQQQLDAQKQE